jgi:hypothetical protein
MRKKESSLKIKADIEGMCGMLKARGSVTKTLLRERRRDKKREAAKYERSRRG